MNILKNNLENNVLLCVGPMSQNCTDATIEIANEKKIPIVFVASRRQIECKQLGGGYVSNTEEFVKYVRERDVGNFIYIQRDHGGPKQGNDDPCLGREQLIENSLISYQQDIQCGFDFIHIDPSLISNSFDDSVELIKFFYDKLNSVPKNKDIFYEVGAESGSGQTSDLKEFRDFVKIIKQINEKNYIKFVVGNTGLFTKELKNFGSFNVPYVRRMVDSCRENDLFFKTHNADYLSKNALKKIRKSGVCSINIAPQLGVVETKTILKWLKNNKWNKQYNDFVRISNESNKWKKWMISEEDRHSMRYKSLISGHYIFNDPHIIDIRKDMQQEEDVDLTCKNNIKQVLNNYIEYLWG